MLSLKGLYNGLLWLFCASLVDGAGSHQSAEGRCLWCPKATPSEWHLCVCVCLSHCLPPLSRKPLRTVPPLLRIKITFELVSEPNRENLWPFHVTNACELTMNLGSFASFALVPERFGETQCSVQCAMLLLCSWSSPKWLLMPFISTEVERQLKKSSSVKIAHVEFSFSEYHLNRVCIEPKKSACSNPT